MGGENDANEEEGGRGEVRVGLEVGLPGRWDLRF